MQIVFARLYVVPSGVFTDRLRRVLRSRSVNNRPSGGRILVSARKFHPARLFK